MEGKEFLGSLEKVYLSEYLFAVTNTAPLSVTYQDKGLFLTSQSNLDWQGGDRGPSGTQGSSVSRPCHPPGQMRFPESGR